MNINENQIENFIRESSWEHEVLQDDLVTKIPESIRSDKAAFVLDDVGIIKQGKHSVGVQRQYSGAIGGVGNCQVAVDLIYAVPGKYRNADQKTWPLGMDLYVPESWINDQERRNEVEMPDNVKFRTKHEIAVDIIERVIRHQVKHKCIVGDSGYGNDNDFRRALRDLKELYALAVTPSDLHVIDPSVPLIAPGKKPGPGRKQKYQKYPSEISPETPVQIAKRVKNWLTVEWSEGTKEKLSGQFYREKVRVVRSKATRIANDEIGWLLLEKCKNQNGDEELKSYICWGMDELPLKTLVEYVHIRWTVELFHRDAKQILGLDRFEGRSWKGWYHHISMVLLAYAFIAELRAKLSPGDKLPTLPSIVRLFVLEVATQQLMIDHNLLRKKAREIAGTMLRRYSDW
jgi:SRSO17 transposase